MLTINTLSEFRSALSSLEEIRESTIGENLNCFCYMISSENTFDTAEARECRGIVFSTTSNRVVGRPLHKFFNVGERAETRVENIDWSKVVRVMDKRDGSMIHTVRTAGGFALKSKKTFDSDVAKAATNLVNSEHGANLKSFCEYIVDKNYTAIFEFTAPTARIVLFYPQEELRLLHVRHNMTGEYMSSQELRELANSFKIGLVDEVNEFFDGAVFNADRMLEAAKTREGIEGWIIQLENGDMVKVKTSWYLLRHRAMTFIRERDIAQLVLDEGLDDMKSLLVADGINIDEILSIESSVASDFAKLANSIDSVYEANKDMTRKDFAIKFKEHEHFGLLMHKFTGKVPNYKEYFERHILREKYTLRQLVMVPSIAEGD